MPRSQTPAARDAMPLRRPDIAFRWYKSVGYHDKVYFGAQSRGLRATCVRFAAWVTPGISRNTRFRLVANLGRVGLNTHRVPMINFKTTSIPLSQASPGALYLLPLTFYLSLNHRRLSCWAPVKYRRASICMEISTERAVPAASM